VKYVKNPLVSDEIEFTETVAPYEGIAGLSQFPNTGIYKPYSTLLVICIISNNNYINKCFKIIYLVSVI